MKYAASFQRRKMNRKKLFCLLLAMFSLVSAGWAQEALSPGDRVRIWVKGEPELTVERTIQSDGAVSYPLLGNVEVAGMKTFEVARVIAKLLDDGFLREPLVQVNLISRRAGASSAVRRTPDWLPQNDSDLVPSSEPLENDSMISETPVAKALPCPCRIEVIDGKTGVGIGGAAMMLGGKIYQSNRLGQMVIDRADGRIILLADGYNLIQGDIGSILRVGPPHKIPMEAISLVEEVTVKVIDLATRLPLSDVEVSLDKMKVRTNGKGIFNVREIKKEFAEIKLSKRGFRSVRKILDFKDPLEQIIPMVRDK